jgi:hypothetical protein
MKKNWLLIIVAVILAIVYAVYFTDWFQPKIIHITSANGRVARTVRTVRASNPSLFAMLGNLINASANANDDSTTVPVIFKLGRPYKLKDLKVVALAEWQTNKNCLPLWHLVAAANSVAITRPFYYGDNLRGMKPEVPGLRARPLQPGVTYRIFVTDGSAKGQHDFQPVPRPDNPVGE